jgi:hypothetical protein
MMGEWALSPTDRVNKLPYSGHWLCRSNRVQLKRGRGNDFLQARDRDGSG